MDKKSYDVSDLPLTDKLQLIEACFSAVEYVRDMQILSKSDQEIWDQAPINYRIWLKNILNLSPRCSYEGVRAAFDSHMVYAAQHDIPGKSLLWFHTVPPSAATIALYDKERVTEIYLTDTAITEIPVWVSDFPNLAELTLTCNKIREIPLWLCKMDNLRVLRLGGNCISEVPEEIAQLFRLETLSLDRNPVKALPDSSFNTMTALCFLKVGIAVPLPAKFEDVTTKYNLLSGAWSFRKIARHNFQQLYSREDYTPRKAGEPK